MQTHCQTQTKFFFASVGMSNNLTPPLDKSSQPSLYLRCKIRPTLKYLEISHTQIQFLVYII